MTQDEIIEMARQACFMPAHYNRVQHFAKLVAEKEREACAKECEGLNLYGGSESRQLQRATIKYCAYAIRARGQA